MAEYIQLNGAEDVRAAGNNMRDAAEQISRSTASLGDLVFRFQQASQEMVAAMSELGEKIAASNSLMEKCISEDEIT